jgi:hypothetical protein
VQAALPAITTRPSPLAVTVAVRSLAALRTATVTANGLGRVVIAGSAACTVRGLAASEVTCGPRR